jgi:hypothetical protein
MVREVQRVTRKTLSSTKSSSQKGIFSVRLTDKPGNIPSVRHYAEKELKNIVECDEGGRKYAVYDM